MSLRPLSFACCLVLCACSGAATAQIGAPQPASKRELFSVARWTAPAHRDLHKTWISRELEKASAPVLFVSDSSTADVYLYSLKTLKLTGTINGFDQPQGECADSKGDVWVTDTNALAIYELSHQGRLENTIDDTDGYPVGCAWDSTTGSLAVMDLFGAGSTAGNVLVFAKGTKLPVTVTNNTQYTYDFGGYDADGNLFFDGRDANGNYMLSELPKGGKSANTVTLTGGKLYFPGMVQWDSTKSELIVGDQSCAGGYSSCLYRISLSGSTGKIVGSLQLKDSGGSAVCDLVQGVEYGGEIAGSDFDFCGSPPSATYLWPYPAGGAPKLSNAKTDVEPIGAAVSP